MKRLKISIIGTGKLGLCLALNLETAGNQLVCYDKDHNYVNSLRTKSFNSLEPGVNKLLKFSRDILFTTDIKNALENDIIFIVVNTPSLSSGKYDHSNINCCLEQVKNLGYQKYRKDIIINCTTFPGYCESVSAELKRNNCYISYNPEFIAQGNIIEDQRQASSIIIGQADQQAGDLIEYLNKCFSKVEAEVHRMSPTEAEIVKLSINCFLTTKISYANIIGDLALRMNCSPDVVLKAIGEDSRIGQKYLQYGFGYGGPCFPRDNKALIACAKNQNINPVLFEATDESNISHLKNQVDYYVTNNTDKSKPVVLEHVTYNKNSFSIEESQQLKYALGLIENGFKIKLEDQRPEALSKISNIKGFINESL